MTDAGLKPRKVARVAVLGGGLMGSGIATALILSGVDVLLKEVNQQFLDVSVHSEGMCTEREGGSVSQGVSVEWKQSEQWECLSECLCRRDRAGECV